MDTRHTVTQADTEDEVVKTTIIFPKPIWSEVKKAAIDDGKTAQQFVIDAMAEKVGLKAA